MVVWHLLRTLFRLRRAPDPAPAAAPGPGVGVGVQAAMPRADPGLVPLGPGFTPAALAFPTPIRPNAPSARRRLDLDELD